MKVRRLKPLLFPTILLAVGFGLGLAAEAAVGRYQNYGVYGLLRPAADLTMLIGAIWLVVALIRWTRAPQ